MFYRGIGVGIIIRNHTAKLVSERLVTGKYKLNKSTRNAATVQKIQLNWHQAYYFFTQIYIISAMLGRNYKPLTMQPLNTANSIIQQQQHT